MTYSGAYLAKKFRLIIKVETTRSRCRCLKVRAHSIYTNYQTRWMNKVFTRSRKKKITCVDGIKVLRFPSFRLNRQREVVYHVYSTICLMHI